MYILLYLTLPTLPKVMYSDQVLLAARKVHVVYLAQILGAALCIHIISNHDTIIYPQVPLHFFIVFL